MNISQFNVNCKMKPMVTVQRKQSDGNMKIKKDLIGKNIMLNG